MTGAADQAARQTVRKLARQNPGAKIVVTGCYATRRPAEVAALPGVAAVVPNERKAAWADEIGLTTAERFAGGEGPCGAALAPGAAGRTAYTLRVQTGCDEVCSYCIIPSTRGRGSSRPLESVLLEMERAAAAGYQEIALTGVHLGLYGRDAAPPSSLMSLLVAIERRAPAPARVRISSLEPMDCPLELVDLVARSTRFAPHFHLPLQHASDAVLRAMRRPYTLHYYAGLVARIRERIPHASIGTDLIVGFPGETAADFEELSRYLESSPLTHVHVFPYSDRPGTAAAAMDGKVHGSTVRDRAARLRELGRELTRRFHASQAGSVRPGLTIDDGSGVVTDNYLKVRIGQGRRRNELVQVRLALAGEQLVGELVEG